MKEIDISFISKTDNKDWNIYKYLDQKVTKDSGWLAPTRWLVKKNGGKQKNFGIISFLEWSGKGLVRTAGLLFIFVLLSEGFYRCSPGWYSWERSSVLCHAPLLGETCRTVLWTCPRLLEDRQLLADGSYFLWACILGPPRVSVPKGWTRGRDSSPCALVFPDLSSAAEDWIGKAYYCWKTSLFDLWILLNCCHDHSCYPCCRMRN